MLECCNCYEQKSRQDKVTGNVGAGEVKPNQDGESQPHGKGDIRVKT